MIQAFANDVWFIAVPAVDDCHGCMFDKQRSSACRAAGEAALAAGMPDCEVRGVSTSIYVKDPSNGRQQDLLVNGQHNLTPMELH